MEGYIEWVPINRENLLIMHPLNLTVQVSRISSRVTPQELNTFFSHCGTVNKIQLYRNKDKSQTALVTFAQPYAFQTALLLDEAAFGGQIIRILPAKDSENPPSPNNLTNETKKGENQGFIPVIHAEMQAIASKGVEVLNKTREEVEENYKLSEKGRAMIERTKSLVSAAKPAAEHVGSKIVNNDYVTKGAYWLSSAMDMASKCAAELGTKRKDNPNSRKQK
ncbi:uncharacterized protein LOC116110682 [Pistacia vera]|uniref:uncharacterized protein LOC116110682 n=1 Tax=Pistacia vera TaxID=55513 RepID=UPI001262F15A|nr:uncharacterized protein LOC116110682 [Pistacia vera]